MLNPAPVHPDLGAALLARCDLVTPNETEFALLLERVGGAGADATMLVGRDDAALHALARQLDVATVVVTLGAHGCFVSHAEAQKRGDAEAFYRIVAERVDVVDTTGAGDAAFGGVHRAVPDAALALTVLRHAAGGLQRSQLVCTHTAAIDCVWRRASGSIALSRYALRNHGAKP